MYHVPILTCYQNLYQGAEAALYYQNLYGMFFAQAIERCSKRMDKTGRIVGISSPGERYEDWL